MRPDISLKNTLCLAGGLLVLFLLAAACTAAPTPTLAPTETRTSVITPDLSGPGTTPAPVEITPTPATIGTLTKTETPAANTPVAPTATTTPAPLPTLGPDEWKNLPAIPTLSAKALAVFEAGQAKGNDPHVFSKVGDCEASAVWFLANFEAGSKDYKLGPYSDLQEVITYFAGSFNRTSLAAKQGFNAASLLSNFWTDRSKCKNDETPLGCEYRLSKSSFAFIIIGTNDVSRKKSFETNLRAVIEFSMGQGVVPILVTKADNVEGDYALNATIAKLALEYDMPLWNFWSTVQPLPNHGLQEDKIHLTHDRNYFDDPNVMKAAWPWRNLNALQVLQVMMLGINQ